VTTREGNGRSEIAAVPVTKELSRKKRWDKRKGTQVEPKGQGVVSSDLQYVGEREGKKT